MLAGFDGGAYIPANAPPRRAHAGVDNTNESTFSL